MTSDEIETARCAKLREINENRGHLNTLMTEKHRLELLLEDIKKEQNSLNSRKIEIEGSLSKLKEPISQARYLLSTKKTDADILQSAYWASKS